MKHQGRMTLSMNKLRKILIGALLLFMWSSCQNAMVHNNNHSYNYYRDSTILYNPDSNPVFFSSRQGLLLYEDKDAIKEKSTPYTNPAIIDFFTKKNLKQARITGLYYNYIANTIYGYQRSQIGRIAINHPMFFRTDYALLYPQDGSQLIFVGDDIYTPGFSDMLIDGKVYRDDKNIRGFIAEIVNRKDFSSNSSLPTTSHPTKTQHSNQSPANKNKAIEHIELYTYVINYKWDILRAPWIWSTMYNSIKLTPERFYDIYKEYLTPIKIESNEDIEVLFNDSIQDTQSYVYYVIRVIYDDESSSLRAVSYKNTLSLDVISKYIEGRPWEGSLSVHDELTEYDDDTM